MLSILYLAHDLDDSAIWRRVSMLNAGGAAVTLAGFRRGSTPLAGPAIVLGTTRNGKMAQRIGMVLKAATDASKSFGSLPKPDVILARNLEMLAVARRIRDMWGDERPGLCYEVLDIHRMMLGDSLRGKIMRRIERQLTTDVGLLVTSSPGFVRNYFAPYKQITPQTITRLIENKVNEFDAKAVPVGRSAPIGEVVRIGWFGILRCAQSLAVLDATTRAAPGKFSVLMAGRPALDAVPDFHDVVAANPDLDFVGPYQNPADLPRLYSAVDLTWLIDRYDAGKNSDWLLPNRLYEGCLHGAIPLALAGTEVAQALTEIKIGIILQKLEVPALVHLLADLNKAKRAQLAKAVATVPHSRWVASRDESEDLVRALENLVHQHAGAPASNAITLQGSLP